MLSTPSKQPRHTLVQAKTSRLKSLRSLLAGAVLALPLCGAHADLAPLTVVGKQVLIGGQVGSMAGASLYHSNTGWGGEKYYNANVVSWLKTDWKTNLVRAAIGVDGSGGYLNAACTVITPAVKTRVYTVIDAAIANDMYVIVDWHSHEAERCTQAAVDFFKEVAGKYGDKNNIIYEVYNEPLNTTDWATVIKPYATELITQIRAIDPDNLIIVGTQTWSQDVDKAAANPITGFINIAYTLHFYAATTAHQASLRNKAQTALNRGIALFVTEWGTVSADGTGTPNTTQTTTWMKFLKDNNISHANWAINNKNEGASVLVTTGTTSQGGWTAEQLTASGTIVADIVRNWNPDTGSSSSASSVASSSSVASASSSSSQSASSVASAASASSASASSSGSESSAASSSPSVIGGNMVTNGTFDTDLASWWTAVEWIGKANFTVLEGQAKIDITVGSDKPWHVMLGQNVIPITTGITYCVKVDASASKAFNLALNIQQNGGAHTGYLNKTWAINQTLKSYVTEFTSTKTDLKAQVQFNMGAQGTGTILLDNFELIQKSGATCEFSGPLVVGEVTSGSSSSVSSSSSEASSSSESSINSEGSSSSVSSLDSASSSSSVSSLDSASSSSSVSSLDSASSSSQLVILPPPSSSSSVSSLNSASSSSQLVILPPPSSSSSTPSSGSTKAKGGAIGWLDFMGVMLLALFVRRRATLQK